METAAMLTLDIVILAHQREEIHLNIALLVGSHPLRLQNSPYSNIKPHIWLNTLHQHLVDPIKKRFTFFILMNKDVTFLTTGNSCSSIQKS